MTGQETHPRITEAAARLRAGQLVVFPTETVYGLGADALSAVAVARVFALKGRPAHNPLIVHVNGAEMARQLALEWPAWAEALAGAFWPGPLTIVVPARESVPLTVRAGGPTVALRAPAHTVAQALLAAFAGPLVGPSANPSGGVSPTSAAHVRAGFADAVRRGELLVLDGGPCDAGIESTVVAERDGVLRVLRPGVIGPAALRVALSHAGARIDVASGAGDSLARGTLASPGLLASHYAPRTRAVLISRDQWEAVVSQEAARGPIALLARGAWHPLGAAHVLVLPIDASGYARGLYAALRQLDETNPSVIAIESPPPAAASADELWIAIADRLSRAARPWPG